MSYTVYFKYGSKKYKLPVNPEEIKRSRKLQVEKYRVIGSSQVSVPVGAELEEISFEAEFPGREYHYVKTSGNFKNADHYEKMFKRAQKNGKDLRFIASNDITDDISMRVLVESVEVVEKAGEEGDKYISLKLLEYKGAVKRYMGVQTPKEVVKQEVIAPTENPAVTENKTHTVGKGDTLWGLAKKYYGNGAMYPKIVAANPSIRNPNLIYDGQVLTIPE
ncbi:MAG: LysM peptidoglycan-binding domain-containing protein [Hungatella sp.]